MQFSLNVSPAGQSRCLYTEAIDLAALGSLTIARASNVEPLPDGRWIADLGLSGGPILGPFPKRSDALAAESEWLEANRL
ncbi:MAG: hypothetical protein ABSF26_09770 [Thermoguttaceae bacterium]|jgi:hypothetical protein